MPRAACASGARASSRSTSSRAGRCGGSSAGTDSRSRGREREKEERRAREEAEAITKGKTASELPGVRLSKLLARYRFVAVGREELSGRCAIAFDFEPRPG